MTTERKWMTIQEAADEIGRAYETVRRRLNGEPDRFKHRKVGGEIMIHPDGMQALRDEYVLPAV